MQLITTKQHTFYRFMTVTVFISKIKYLTTSFFFQTVNLDTTIKDQNDEQFKAFDIFAFAIKYLKEQAVGQLLKSLTNVKTKDIHYVLTVPAIWDDKAKIFMRKAAEKVCIRFYKFQYSFFLSSLQR